MNNDNVMIIIISYFIMNATAIDHSPGNELTIQDTR